MRSIAVIPFEVGPDAAGLGVGIAAFAQQSFRSLGLPLAVAQMMTNTPSGPVPVEAWIPPLAWKQLSERGGEENLPKFDVVVTGRFHEPTEDAGVISLYAFDPRTHTKILSTETVFDEAGAGTALYDSLLAPLFELLGGGIKPPGLETEFATWDWETALSVLSAERSLLGTPGSHSGTEWSSALSHLGRALEGTPGSSFIARRVAQLAAEVASGHKRNDWEFALRSIERALLDAPEHIELEEAKAHLFHKLGREEDAARLLERAIEIAPKRARLYAFLGEMRRTAKDLPGAEEVLDRGLLIEADPVLLTGRGLVHFDKEEMFQAEDCLSRALGFSPLYFMAYLRLSQHALKTRRADLATVLVDRALDPADRVPEALKLAYCLCERLEPEGPAREARLGHIAEWLENHLPNDPWSMLLHVCRSVRAGKAREAERALAPLLEHSSVVVPYAIRAVEHALSPAASAEADAVLRSLGFVWESNIPHAGENWFRRETTSAHYFDPAVLDRARRLHRDLPSWRSYLALSTVLNELGEFREALALLAPLREKAAWRAVILIPTIRALIGTGDLAEAEALLENVVHDPKTADEEISFLFADLALAKRGLSQANKETFDVLMGELQTRFPYHPKLAQYRVAVTVRPSWIERLRTKVKGA